MTGSPPPRDWDKELAEIDKLIARQPAPSPPPPAAQRAAPGAPAPAARALPPAPRGRAALGTWVKVALGVTVAAGVGLSWPYAHPCGLSLYGYLAASIGVVLAGLWGATSSWRHRIAAAHLISLLVILSGGLLLAKTILDRTSYPRTPTTWSCPTPSRTSSTAAGPAPAPANTSRIGIRRTPVISSAGSRSPMRST